VSVCALVRMRHSGREIGVGIIKRWTIMTIKVISHSCELIMIVFLFPMCVHNIEVGQL